MRRVFGIGRPGIRCGISAALSAVALSILTCLSPATSASASEVPFSADGSYGSGRAATAGVARAADPRPDEVEEDVVTAVTTVEQYWTIVFRSSGRTFHPVRRVYPYIPGDGSACGTEEDPPRNARYCQTEDDIAFDVLWLADMYDELGDAFVYLTIGHEYAHAVQARLGIRHRYTIGHELQADCFAGAYLGYQTKAEVLVIEKGDIDELVNGLQAIADPEGTPWFDPGAHGTGVLRARWFAAGFTKGLGACSTS